MPENNQMPHWVLSALGRARTREPYPAPEPEWPITPEAGDIRAARPIDISDGESRLVLILGSDSDTGIVSTALTASGGSESTAMDVRFEPNETGLSFPLTIETDVVSPLWFAQLGPRLTTFPANLTSALSRLPFALVESDPEGASELKEIRSLIPDHKRGLPTSEPSDPLWAWKKRELDTMRSLGRDCIRSVLEETGTETVFDLAVLGSLSDPAEDPWSQAKQALLLSAWAKQPDNLRSFDGLSATELPDLFNFDAFSQRPFGSEIWNALEPIRQKFLRETGPSFRGKHQSLVWHPNRKRMAEEDQLSSRISSCFASGKRNLRLMTSATFWDVAERPGIFVVDLEGVRIQIHPDFLEDRSLENDR
jgi:hypothetical protein